MKATPLTKIKQIFYHHRMGLSLGLIVFGAIVWVYHTQPLATTAVLASALRQSVPLALGALCGLIGERSGVMNIGIEGQMLMAAFCGFMISVWSGNLLIAAISAVTAGALMGLMLAFMTVGLKIDQIISGVVINILAFGVSGYFYQTGLSTAGKLQAFPLGALAKIPLVGPVFFNNPPITCVTVLLVFGVHVVLFYTPWGLRTRAVGEHPKAADTLGINVYLIRYINLAVGGAIAGLAGAFLTLEAVGTFERGMTNGRGFVALAVMIFGKWTPFGAWGAALLFGLATAVQTQLQFAEKLDIPHQFIGMLPYLLTVAVLAGFVGRAQPPQALGTPYTKD